MGDEEGEGRDRRARPSVEETAWTSSPSDPSFNNSPVHLQLTKRVGFCLFVLIGEKSERGHDSSST